MASNKKKEKKLSFDFFCCSAMVLKNKNHIDKSEIFFDLLDDILKKFSEKKTVYRKIGSNTYELRFLEKTDYGYRGIIGKHSDSDLPYAAEIGGNERPIPLSPDENLLEKSYFNIYRDYSIIILQRNRCCINYRVLGKFFSNSDVYISLDPVILPESLSLLIDNRIQIRNLELSIAKPTNPELFKDKCQHPFNNSIIQSINCSNSSKFNLTLRGNSRADVNNGRYLASTLKGALSELLSNFDVKKCKALLEDECDMVTHPVDLILDRIIYDEKIKMNGRYPLESDIWQALTNARKYKDKKLEQYFGALNKPRLK